MEVRRLTVGQEAELLAGGELFDHPVSLPAARDYLADNRNVFFVALDGKELIGFLRGTSLRQIHSGRLQMFLYEIGVAASHRRRGVGTELIRSLLEYCRKGGYEEIFVFTDPGNEPAVRLYRSTGAETETPADRMFVYHLHSEGQ